MKKFKTLILAVTTLTILVACDPPQQPQTGESGGGSAIDVMHRRTSIRSYTDAPVARETLETIVRAGMSAPSAMNKQPWKFIIVDDREVLDAFGERLRTSRMVAQAPAAILVCGDLEKAGEDWLQQYWIQDCSAASQNILLAITDLGLGGVWTSLYPAQERIAIAAELLNLPDHIVPLNIIPLGHPVQEPTPQDKWSQENIRWNRF